MSKVSVVFLLVEKNGDKIVPYKKTRYDEVECDDKLSKFKDAVKLKYTNNLKHLDAPELKVFETKEDVGIDAKELEFDKSVSGHDTRQMALYVLVPDEENKNDQKVLFVYNGRITGCMDMKGSRRKMYYYAMESAGLYPQPPNISFQYDTEEARKKDLLIHVVFEFKIQAIQFETFALQLSSIGSISQQIKPPNFEFNRIKASDYIENDSDSLPYTLDRSSMSHSSVAENDDLYIYQRIESENDLHVASVLNVSEKAHIILEAHCRSHPTTYGKYRTDKNNIITLSLNMHKTFNHYLPLFKLSFVEASKTPVLDGRYKVTIAFEAYNQDAANYCFARLKDGTQKTDNELICHVFVHVLDWKVMKYCLDWRSNHIEQNWKQDSMMYD